jgi:hypothetical protein
MKSEQIQKDTETKSARIVELSARQEAVEKELATLKDEFARNIARNKTDKSKSARAELLDQADGLSSGIELLREEVAAGEKQYSAELYNEAREVEAAAIADFEKARAAAADLCRTFYCEKARAAFETVRAAAAAAQTAQYSASNAAKAAGITGRIAKTAKDAPNPVATLWEPLHKIATGESLIEQLENERAEQENERRAARAA